jgi:type IV pilus assembly protein PilB
LLQLLPVQNYTLKLAEFEIPRAVLELVPVSVAWENLVLPLDLQAWVLLVVNTDPHNQDTIQKLQFILNKDIVAVRAEEADLRATLVRYFNEWDVEYVDSVLVEFADREWASPGRPFHPALASAADAPVVRLVNLILAEAINLHADTIQLSPTQEAVTVRYRIRGEWIERDSLPSRLGQGIAVRIALIAGIDATAVLDGRFPAPDEATGEFRMGVRGAEFRISAAILPHTFGYFIEMHITEQLTQLTIDI